MPKMSVAQFNHLPKLSSSRRLEKPNFHNRRRAQRCLRQKTHRLQIGARVTRN